MPCRKCSLTGCYLINYAPKAVVVRFVRGGDYTCGWDAGIPVEQKQIAYKVYLSIQMKKFARSGRKNENNIVEIHIFLLLQMNSSVKTHANKSAAGKVKAFSACLKSKARCFIEWKWQITNRLRPWLMQ